MNWTKEPFSEQFVKEIYNVLKNLLCNVRAPWMLKVLNETIDANKNLYFKEWMPLIILLCSK